MKENDLSLNQLAKMSDLSINTLRELKNNPSHNTNLSSLMILAQDLECNLKDLIEDDIATIRFEDIAEEYKDHPLFLRQQVFSPENVHFLRNLLLQVGVPCKVSPYGSYRTASIKNEYESGPIRIDFNIRVSGGEKDTTIEVVDFYVCVNHLLLNEAVIKEAFIKSFETYARKLKINQIYFKISTDFERQTNHYWNENSELPADFTYTYGTDSTIFTQNYYEHSPYSYFEDYQIEWRKIIC